uniref:Uncharacterized protein n=1 Tax=Arundo donax TaxID=35708 RepID=A0A0A9F1C5_ARUDO
MLCYCIWSLQNLHSVVSYAFLNTYLRYLVLQALLNFQLCPPLE